MEKIIKVRKAAAHYPSLNIGREEWMLAFRELSFVCFALWLYCMNKRDDSSIRITFEDVERDLGISYCAYVQGMKKLLDSGYMDKISNKFYIIYDKPKKTSVK